MSMTRESSAPRSAGNSLDISLKICPGFFDKKAVQITGLVISILMMATSSIILARQFGYLGPTFSFLDSVPMWATCTLGVSGSISFVFFMVKSVQGACQMKMTPEEQLKQIFTEKVIHTEERQDEIQKMKNREYLTTQRVTLYGGNTWIALHVQEHKKELLDKKYQEKLQAWEQKHPEEVISDDEKIELRETAKAEIAAPEIDKLIDIYGDETNIPSVYTPIGDPSISDKQFKLLQLTNQEIVDLKLSVINKFDQSQLHILTQRLQQIEEGGGLQTLPKENGTIGSFRAILDWNTLIQAMKENPELAGLLSKEQVAFVFENPEGIIKEKQNGFNVFHAILPLTMGVEKDYTRIKLAHLHMLPNMSQLFHLFPPSHIRLMPDSFFSASHWEWTAETIQGVLVNLNDDHVVKLVQSLEIDVIKRHADILTNEHFEVFTAEQLRSVEFPWATFSKKLGWGDVARKKIVFQDESSPVQKKRIAIRPSRLTWTEINLDALKNFFKLKENCCQELSYLTVDTIAHVSSIWELDHLQHFSKEQRNNPKFPWDVFVKQGIVTALLSIYKDQPGLSEISLPWDRLSKTDLKSLFTTSETLHGFEVTRVNQFAHAFDVTHLSLLHNSIWQHKDFQWNHFIDKKGIGTFLFQNRDKVLGIQDNIPWHLLPPAEIGGLFPEILGARYQTITSHAESFFKSLQLSTVIKLAPHLTADYLTFCNKWFKEHDFPWQEFIKKRGIGAAIRAIHLVDPCVPWKELAKSDIEMQGMLAPAQSSAIVADQVDCFLQRLPCSTIAIIAAHIPAHYLEYFTFDQRIKDEFPWKEFVAKEKIVPSLNSVFATLSQLPVKDQNVYAEWYAITIPWSEMKVEDFKNFFSGRHPDAIKQATMKYIRAEEFTRMVTKFGKDAFTAIVQYASDSYKRNSADWFTREQLRLL